MLTFKEIKNNIGGSMRLPEYLKWLAEQNQYLEGHHIFGSRMGQKKLCDIMMAKLTTEQHEAVHKKRKNAPTEKELHDNALLWLDAYIQDRSLPLRNLSEYLRLTQDVKSYVSRLEGVYELIKYN